MRLAKGLRRLLISGRRVTNQRVSCPERGEADVEMCYSCPSLRGLHTDRETGDLYVRCSPPSLHAARDKAYLQAPL